MNITSIFLIVLIIICPIVIFYQRSNWTKKQRVINIILLSILFSLIYGPLHEFCHFLAAKMMGIDVIDSQFFSKYSDGKFQNAYIRTSQRTTNQEIVILIVPYIKDLIFAVIGFLILKQKSITYSFLTGLIFSIGLLYSTFDIADNFLGYVVQNFGDWSQLSQEIGHFWTWVIGLGMFGITLFLTCQILLIYKGFPDENKKLHPTCS